MKISNIKISKLISIYLSVIFLVITIFMVSSLYSLNTLWNNTDSLYNHPLKVSEAVGEISVDVLSIHRDIRQLPIEDDLMIIEKLINEMDVYDAKILQVLPILSEKYLGPKADIENITEALNKWKSIRNETIRLYRAGQIEEVVKRVKASGVGGEQATIVANYLSVIRDFASNKADSLYLSAQDQRNQIISQMSFFGLGTAIMLIVIGFLLKEIIVPPMVKLTSAIKSINEGKLDTRIQNDSLNELGILSKAFNSMSDTIQSEIKFNENAAKVSSIAVKNSTLILFCQELLSILYELTESQISAIYFLNENNGQFERFESIGAKLDNMHSFSSSKKEGEFGALLATKKVQHITDIPTDAQMIFVTVSGDFKAKEIITIPIMDGNTLIAIISLASIKRFSVDSIRLTNGIVNEISASLKSVLAAQRVVDFSNKLIETNAELEQQSRELITQTHELNQQNIELEMQKEQLNEVNRLKTNFLSNMSHELRTPLNSVIALSGVLSRRLTNKISDEEKSYLEIIERNGKNLLALINDILDISRIEAGREDVEISEFRVNQVVSEVLEMMEPLAHQQNISLFNKSKDTAIVLNNDRVKIRHILQNLIGNAVKFTAKGSVSIEVSQSEKDIQIIVSDTGIGISEKQIPYIFDEFRQADSSTSRRFGGTGLGLAISMKYANLLGGTITVKSVVDVGSEFTLTIPNQFNVDSQTSELQAKVSSKVKNKVQGSFDNNKLIGKTVLLVEDNESSIIQIKDLLSEIGCKVQVAQDAKEAFSVIEKGIPDAMILDLMMPDIDGFKVLEILRNAEQTAHIPVMILTAKHITKDELKFLKRNNIHQLIQKGDIKRNELQLAVIDMLFPLNENNISLKKDLDIQNKPIVLIVEDNPDNMTTVKALLEDRAIVIEAFNAHDGIALTGERLPNLILMDIALPDINGIEAFKEIRKLPHSQHIPVIALTASVMKNDRETILSYGFDAFIAKPIIAQEFYKTIDEVLYGK